MAGAIRNEAQAVPPAIDDPDGHVPWAILAPIQMGAMKRYRPTPLETRGILFLSQEMTHELRGPKAIQRARSLFTAGLEIVTLPGEHLTLLREPYIREVAARLNEILTSMRGK